MHRLVHSLTPPLIRNLVRYGRGSIHDRMDPIFHRLGLHALEASIRYFGPFANWPQSRAASSGYEQYEILKRVADATMAVLEDRAAYEQDGMTFAELPNAVDHAMLGVLLGLAARRTKPVVLDFGGALGSHWLRWRRWLTGIHDIEWHVVEQPIFAEEGERIFRSRNMPVLFHSSIESIKEQPNAVLASSVLQYLPDPLGMLEKLAELRPESIVVDRTPLTDGKVQYLVQRTSKPFYPASYPLQTINLDAINSILMPRYTCIEHRRTDDAPIRIDGVTTHYYCSVWLRQQ